MAHYLIISQRGIEDLFEDTQIITNDLLVEERIRDITNNIRIMVSRRRVSLLNQQRVQEQREERQLNRPPAELRPRVYPYNSEKPITKTKVVSLFDLNTPCTTQCAICFDNHKIVDSLTTDCNHEFGKECYNEWIKKQNSCPICRNVCKTTTVYKGRNRRNNV